jgi:hypothetical protein
VYGLAFLFFVAAVYNGFTGDYENSVAGLTISLVLVLSKITWDDTANSNGLKQIGATAAVSIAFIALGYFSILVLNEIEISSQGYIDLALYSEAHPEVHKAADVALKDGKISVVEYHELQESYLKLASESAKQFLNKE